MSIYILYGCYHKYFCTMLHIQQLLQKYNKPVPRYTSYPTVPNWYNFNNTIQWEQEVKKKYAENRKDGISLYIHLPFCESLCTYCGCNKKITTNHNVESEYIKAILAEWEMYCILLGEKPVIRELHLGGGTPTFFSPQNLQLLLSNIFNTAIIHPGKEFSFEGHPNNTTIQHLNTLFSLGFTRVSFGVQDNDPVVQRAINRIQPFEHVKKATENARKAGFTSVNFDLIYGLPFQTQQGMEETFNQVISLKPDRIAFYSYAHVPWKQKAQRLFDETNLPAAAKKMQLYMLGKTALCDAGYTDIGMDHFSLPHDALYLARANKTLHRNFMGYTTTHTNFLVGLGVSAISDIGTAYAQNAKELENYYRSIQMGRLACIKGIFLAEEDLVMKEYIKQLACVNHVSLHKKDLDLLYDYTMPALLELQKDGLVTINGLRVTVTGTGGQFIRNVCNAFDMYESNDTLAEQNKFSKAV